MGIIFLFIGLILTFSLGFFFILLVAPKLKRLEQAALGWVIGLGLVTQELFLLSILNIDYSILSVLTSFLISNFFLWFFVRKKINFKIRFKFSVEYLISWIRRWFEELSLAEHILIILLTIFILGSFVKALFWPVYYWDALALYDYRAKIFYEAGGIAQSMKLASLPLHTFPPMTSLAHTLVYILGGKDANPQFIYPLFYFALLVTFYFSISTYSKRWVSLLFTFFLASIPFFVEFAANAYTNLPYAFYFGMGLVYLSRFMQKREKGVLVISGVFLGLAGWTRSPTEQFFLATLVVLLIWSVVLRKDYGAVIVLTFLFVIFSLPWRWYVLHILKTGPIAIEITQAIGTGLTSSIDLKKFFTVLGLLFRSIKGVSGTSLFLALITTILFLKMTKKNIFLLLLIISNFLILIFGSYAFSLSWPDWKDSILNSAHRLSMFLPPIALYYCVVSIPGFSKKRKKKR